ncbi:polysaccharide deacetylase family protein [Rhodococcus sp. NPDC055024]
MRIALPQGKQVAVNFGVDFDAHACWMGMGLTSPGFLSRGEFDAEVGVPRVLAAFERYGVTGNFFTPGHTMATFPDRFTQVVEAGHEISAHGCYHESLATLSGDEERRLMERQIEQHLDFVGVKPRGYRSPSWDYTESTLSILEEFGFDWDSSLMGRDFEPYRPRPVDVNWETGSTHGKASSVVEFPVSWHLDDIVATDYIPGRNTGLGSTEVIFQRWKDHFDFARERMTGGIVCYTVHPQSIGRAHNLLMLERLLEHMVDTGDVWFAGLSDIYERVVD